MNNILKPICFSRNCLSVLLTVSLLAALFCYVNLPIVCVGLIEILALAGCIAFFRKVDVTQYELFKYKTHWFWRICEWYWAVYFCFIPLLNMVQSENDKLCIFDYLFPYKYCLSLKTSVTLINHSFNLNIFLFIAVFLTLPIWYIITKFLFNSIILFFQKFSHFEVIYVSAAITVLLSILILICSKTSFFVYPVDNQTYLSEEGTIIHYKYRVNMDHFLDSDTGGMLELPYYTIGDHSRHPYFSRVITLFFPLLLLLGSMFNVFFNSYAYSFAIGISVIQIFLYVLTGVLLIRIYSSMTTGSFAGCLGIIYICSFPAVFVLCPERLIFSSFFLVLSIYLIIVNSKDIYILFVAFLAIGTTSLSLLPIFIAYYLKRKRFNILLAVIPLCLLTLHNGLGWWWSDNNIHFQSANSSFYQKFSSYNQLLESCFLVPECKAVEVKKHEISNSDGEKITISPKCIIQTTLKKTLLQTNITGCVCIVLSCISMYLFKKELIIRISFLWLLISVILVGVLGFGNNQCVLYCSYFSWAVIPLALLPIYWLRQKFPRLPVPQALCLFAVYLAICNLYFIYQIVQIVGERYIVPPGM